MLTSRQQREHANVAEASIGESPSCLGALVVPFLSPARNLARHDRGTLCATNLDQLELNRSTTRCSRPAAKVLGSATFGYFQNSPCAELLNA
jgi:hypothetical protein